MDKDTYEARTKLEMSVFAQIADSLNDVLCESAKAIAPSIKKLAAAGFIVTAVAAGTLGANDANAQSIFSSKNCSNAGARIGQQAGGQYGQAAGGNLGALAGQLIGELVGAQVGQSTCSDGRDQHGRVYLSSQERNQMNQYANKVQDSLDNWQLSLENRAMAEGSNYVRQASLEESSARQRFVRNRQDFAQIVRELDGGAHGGVRYNVDDYRAMSERFNSIPASSNSASYRSVSGTAAMAVRNAAQQIAGNEFRFSR